MDGLNSEINLSKNYLAKNSINDEWTTDGWKYVIRLFKMISIVYTDAYR